MFYAAKNYTASETSIGFANTWYCVGFESKKMRDAHVAESTDKATRSIKASEIGKYDGKVGKVHYFDKEGNLFLYANDPNGGYFYRASEDTAV